MDKEKDKKRDRSANFSPEEIKRLISLVELRKDIIECKKNDTITKQNKEKAWKAIEADFNAASNGVFRNSKDLKSKYESLKKDSKKKANVVRDEGAKNIVQTKISPQLTPLEEKIKDMIFTIDETKSKLGSSEFAISETSTDAENLSPETYIQDNGSKEKREIAVLRKQILEEELKQMEIKETILREELEQKRNLYTLQEKELLLRIELLNVELKAKS